MDEIAKQLQISLLAIKGCINLACKKYHRTPSEVQLIAASKSQSAAKIRTLVNLGQKDFGENYAQELEAKAEQLKDIPINWIYIGHLQSNKIQKIVRYSHEIQTVADLRHAKLIAHYAEEFKKIPFPIYIEVNAGDEPQKSGVPLANVENFALEISQKHPNLDIQGIMSIPPVEFADKDFESRPPPELYTRLAALASRVGRGKLSLGMSNDLTIAIAAGSTCVRIGRALMGERR